MKFQRKTWLFRNAVVCLIVYASRSACWRLWWGPKADSPEHAAGGRFPCLISPAGGTVVHIFPADQFFFPALVLRFVYGKLRNSEFHRQADWPRTAWC